MYHFERVLTLSALALGLVAVGAPSKAAAQSDASATVSKDSIARDSVVKDSIAKAKKAECTKANQAMNALIQKAMKEQQAQPKDSTKPKGGVNQVSVNIGPGDLPPGVTMQTIMQCQNGGGRPRRATPPKPAKPDSAKPADTTKTKP